MGLIDLGRVILDDPSLTGIENYILSTNKLNGKWYHVRADVNAGTSGYFNTSSFSILWNLSSSAYGWAICMSDNEANERFLVYGKLSSKNWRWFEIQRTEVN